MLSTVCKCWLILVWLCLTAGIASAGEHVPTALRVPVVGVRYSIALASFAPLPDSVASLCPGLAPDENMRGIFWVYASAREGDAAYYVVGGYGIRAKPVPPGFPRYELQDQGTVVKIRGQNCIVLGDAREVFQARYFEETPQRVLQALADDLIRRLSGALGGVTTMRAELRRQHINVGNISPEVSKAFAAKR